MVKSDLCHIFQSVTFTILSIRWFSSASKSSNDILSGPDALLNFIFLIASWISSFVIGGPKNCASLHCNLFCDLQKVHLYTLPICLGFFPFFKMMSPFFDLLHFVDERIFFQRFLQYLYTLSSQSFCGIVRCSTIAISPFLFGFITYFFPLGKNFQFHFLKVKVYEKDLS